MWFGIKKPYHYLLNFSFSYLNIPHSNYMYYHSMGHSLTHFDSMCILKPKDLIDDPSTLQGSLQKPWKKGYLPIITFWCQDKLFIAKNWKLSLLRFQSFITTFRRLNWLWKTSKLNYLLHLLSLPFFVTFPVLFEWIADFRT